MLTLKLQLIKHKLTLVNLWKGYIYISLIQNLLRHQHIFNSNKVKKILLSKYSVITLKLY